MNFLEGEIKDDGGVTKVVGKGFALALSEKQIASLAAANTTHVSVGVRPFAIKPASNANSTIDLNVKLVEYLGSSSVLICMVGDEEVQVEMDSASSPTGMGNMLQFSVEPDDIYLFDRETEVRV